MEEEYIEIGKIDVNLLKKCSKLKTEKLIITKERIEHINKRHNNDYKLYGHYIPEIIDSPDYILKDIKNDETLLYLKTIEELNLQVVIKLYTKCEKNKSNTIITFWHMRKKSYEQILKKNEKVFDKNE